MMIEAFVLTLRVTGWQFFAPSADAQMVSAADIAALHAIRVHDHP
jgi:hypothetical protein